MTDLTVSIQHLLVGAELPCPEGRYAPGPVEHVVVLEYGRNPSTDYYIRPRVPGTTESTVFIDISTTTPRQFTVADGTFVIVVRYLTPEWGKLLASAKNKLRGVALFVDDDLPAALLAKELPLRYRYKILRLFHLQRRILRRICSELWVSTTYLSEKYSASKPIVIGPMPLTNPSGPRGEVIYFYHGTASHLDEFCWLKGVVARVQHERPNLTFVAIGDKSIHRIFREIPRTLCLHPTSWETYLTALPALPHHIGLAPLLDRRFNNARSHTKFFDFTRLGAVGIYSRRTPYVEWIRAGVDGVLVDHTPDAWASAITSLADDPCHRTRLLDSARERVVRIMLENDRMRLPMT